MFVQKNLAFKVNDKDLLKLCPAYNQLVPKLVFLKIISTYKNKNKKTYL